MQREVPNAIDKYTKEFARMVVKGYINKIKKDYEKISIFRDSRYITNTEEHIQISREYTQLSKGEFNQEALIEYLKNTDKTCIKIDISI